MAGVDVRSAWLVIAPFVACFGAPAQQAAPTDTERVVAVLRECDPVRDGGGAGLLDPKAVLNEAIVAVARSPQTERVVRRRALRLARALVLPHRLTDAQPRDVRFWLALDELSSELPEPLRPLLLARASLPPAALQAAQQQLTAASAVADRFCRDWNENRVLDAEHAAQNRSYDELEAALTAAGDAAVPALLRFLVVPPDVSFSENDQERGVTARRQVRAIHALSRFTKTAPAMPFFVMHTGGPSLTQSSCAGEAIQVFSGQKLGAGFLNQADEEALMTWWDQHRAEHAVVIDYLVQHLVGLARRDYESVGAARSKGLWCAVMRLDRVLGRREPPASDASVEVLQARLDEVELEWLQRALR